MVAPTADNANHLSFQPDISFHLFSSLAAGEHRWRALPREFDRV
jgi:hypothetical protein